MSCLLDATTMNGFSDHGMDEGNFGAAKGISVSAFDAFRKFTSLAYTLEVKPSGHLLLTHILFAILS